MIDLLFSLGVFSIVYVTVVTFIVIAIMIWMFKMIFKK